MNREPRNQAARLAARPAFLPQACLRPLVAKRTKAGLPLRSCIVGPASVVDRPSAAALPSIAGRPPAPCGFPLAACWSFGPRVSRACRLRLAVRRALIRPQGRPRQGPSLRSPFRRDLTLEPLPARRAPPPVPRQRARGRFRTPRRDSVWSDSAPLQPAGSTLQATAAASAES